MLYLKQCDNSQVCLLNDFLILKLNRFISKVVIKSQQHPTTVTDKVRNRLEQLDDFEEVLCNNNNKWIFIAQYLTQAGRAHRALQTNSKK